ncbi:MAG: hypothetical protein RIB67_11545 [Miltoncostaeaceae bacterium]
MSQIEIESGPLQGVRLERVDRRYGPWTRLMRVLGRRTRWRSVRATPTTTE